MPAFFGNVYEEANEEHSLLSTLDKEVGSKKSVKQVLQVLVH